MPDRRRGDSAKNSARVALCSGLLGARLGTLFAVDLEGFFIAVRRSASVTSIYAGMEYGIMLWYGSSTENYC